MKIQVWFATALLAAFASVAIASQQSETKPAAAAAPSANEQAMMEAWMKSMTPGDNHKMLAGMAGTWDTRVKSWMAPGAPPLESGGTSENRLVLGGRYVEMRFNGSFMNMPFEGIGYTGYDNINKQFTSTWMDNMSTSIMVTNGSWDAAAKTLTFTGSMPDPMSGKPQSIRETVRIIDNDTHVMEMWGPAPDGKPFKMMEITYTRKK